ncbi:MAG: hypothetical protein V1908_03930 [Candidatus Peregrinibacteria bacterium]
MKRFLAIIGLVLLLGNNLAFANARDDFKDSLEARQVVAVGAFDLLHTRVEGMNSNDPKKEGLKNFKLVTGEEVDLLEVAEDKVNTFKDLSAANHIVPEGNEGPFEADQEFLDAERAALNAVNDVNRFIFSPARPGGGEGTVPQGDLMQDFIPQAIRQLFRFAWLAILSGLVVASILLVIAFDNEEFHTQAKKILYYSLIGFVFVALAFALTKAITNIDFFNFI